MGFFFGGGIFPWSAVRGDMGVNHSLMPQDLERFKHLVSLASPDNSAP